jgi:DNA-binding CsgD family transcriptional regulator
VATRERAAERLLDRQKELDVIAGSLDTSEGGTGALLVLEGGAGIGKTRLLTSTLELGGARGMRCLSAVGGELERELPFGVVRQLLEPVLLRAGDAERERLLEGAAGLAAPAVDPHSDPTEVPASFATLHGLYWLTANLAAERPLVLAVDDAHWADTPSLRFLIYLARRLEGIPVLVAATVRTGEPETAGKLVSALLTVDQARVLRPGPLGEAAVAELVEQGLGETPAAAFAHACHAATHGNPFLARELVVELSERSVSPGEAEAAGVAQMASEGVARAVLRRLGRLPEGSSEVARAVAILNGGADLATVAHVAELSPDRASDLVDALAGAGMLERGTPLRFVHPLVRAAIAGTIGPGELDSFHRRAAAVLTRRGDDGDRVAAHLAAARPAGETWVVDALVAAARRATLRGAPDAAAGYLRRALAEPPPAEARGEVLVELGVAEVRMGKPSSIDHLEQAVAQAGDPVGRGRATLALGRALATFGRWADAVPVIEAAIDELGDADPELTLELEADLLSAAPLGFSTRTAGLERIERVADELVPDHPAACKILASLAREEMTSMRSREHAIELAERSLEGGFLMADEPVPTFPFAPVVLTYSGELERAVQVYDDALARTRERGAVLSTTLLASLRGVALHMQGHLAKSAADTREALETAESYGAAQVASYAACFLTWTLIAQGELGEAASVFERLDDVLAGPESFAGISALRVRGQLRTEQGRAEEAVADLRLCGRRLEAWRVLNPGLVTWRAELAIAEHRLGNHRDAAEAAAEQVELARRWGAGWVLADALRVAGVIEGGPDGESKLREAVEVARAGGARFELARALVEQGALLRRSGARRESREPLREGLDLALACGARPVAEKAHTELVASGAQPRRLRETGPDSLTPAERRVAGMAAEGMTNRAIAQALFVSEKTVETHLRSVFRKLDLTSRSQLPAALATAAT